MIPSLSKTARKALLVAILALGVGAMTRFAHERQKRAESPASSNQAPRAASPRCPKGTLEDAATCVPVETQARRE